MQLTSRASVGGGAPAVARRVAGRAPLLATARLDASSFAPLSSRRPRPAPASRRASVSVRAVAEANKPTKVEVAIDNESDPVYTVRPPTFRRAAVAPESDPRSRQTARRRTLPRRKRLTHVRPSPFPPSKTPPQTQVITLRGQNRPGLLTAVTAAFRDLGLEVAKASVGGDQAAVDDRFFVSYAGEGGGKVLGAADAESVRRALEALMLRGGGGGGGGGGAGGGGAASAAARKAARPKFSTVSMQLDSSKRELLYTLMDTYRKNDVLSIQESIVGHVEYTLARTRYQFDDREAYQAAAHSLRDRLIERWNDTQTHFKEQDPKRVYYLSMEFLMGRSLLNTLYNLGIRDQYVEVRARVRVGAWFVFSV